MLGLPWFLMTQRELDAEKRRKNAEADRRLATVEDWTSRTAFKKELNLRASSFRPSLLFGGEESLSSCMRWRYKVRILPRGEPLNLRSGARKGTAMFDGPVKIPVLHCRNSATEAFVEAEPWMSMSPHEMISLRSGTALSRGKTIVAGLGLGHQLCEVAARKKVSEVVLVERDQELVDFVLPELRRTGLLVRDPIVIVDDARAFLRKAEADVALVDIFHRWGEGKKFLEWAEKNCEGIRRIWCWG